MLLYEQSEYGGHFHIMLHVYLALKENVGTFQLGSYTILFMRDANFTLAISLKPEKKRVCPTK